MKKMLTSCFGLGYLPLAPGSWGSLPPVVIYMVLAYLTNQSVVIVVLAALVLAGAILTIRLAPFAIAQAGDEDPSSFVLDEVAGQSLTLLIISLYGIVNICTTAAAAFFLYRLFDAVKPWPCNRLEKLHAGWGILLDDLMAGVYAGVAFLLCKNWILT